MHEATLANLDNNHLIYDFDPNTPVGASLVQPTLTNLILSRPQQFDFPFDNSEVGTEIPYYLKNNNPINQDNLLSKINNFFQSPTFKNINYGISSLSSLAGIYLGFKNLGLMKDQVNLAKEQWNMTKQELKRIKKIRNKLTQSYMNS